MLILLGTIPFVWVAILPDDFPVALQLQSRGFGVIYNWQNDTVWKHPTHVYANDESITADDCRLICRLPRLYALQFMRGDMSNLNLDEIGNCPELLFFQFRKVDRFPSCEIRKLAACPKLVSLQISSTVFKITRDDIEPLSACPLVQVNLESAGLSDVDMDVFTGFAKLVQLGLEGNIGITDAAFEHFAKIPSLKRLVLQKTSVTKEGVEEFQKKRPDVTFFWE